MVGTSITMDDVARNIAIDHLQLCLVTWPLNESEAEVDLALIETSLLLSREFLLIRIKITSLT